MIVLHVINYTTDQQTTDNRQTTDVQILLIRVRASKITVNKNNNNSRLASQTTYHCQTCPTALQDKPTQFYRDNRHC